MRMSPLTPKGTNERTCKALDNAGMLSRARFGEQAPEMHGHMNPRTPVISKGAGKVKHADAERGEPVADEWEHCNANAIATSPQNKGDTI